MRVRIWITAGIVCLSGLSLAVAAAFGGQSHPAPTSTTKTDSKPAAGEFSSAVQPLLRTYCVSCHSTKLHKAGLNLEKYKSISDVHANINPWQGVIDHLQVEDMPPPGSRQPTQAEKSRALACIKHLLAAEAMATQGDPGYVPLRRLSNTEYNCTIRDLTGVDLSPASEFPADGAAGEGFTNAAEALTDVSPALLTKYFAAAKSTAEHAVLLPDGFRFGAGTSRREWTDESTLALRQFYSKWTGPDGRLDFTPYLLATVKHRAELRSGVPIETVASREALNAKYLGVLWSHMTAIAASDPLRSIQAEWSSCDEQHVPALAAHITEWQAALWRTARIGSYVKPEGSGYAESITRQIPGNPAATASAPVRLTVKPAPGQNEVVIRLASHDMNQLHGTADVLWENPRFEGEGKSPLRLQDYSDYGSTYEADYPAIFADTSRYLAAVVELVNTPAATAASVARAHGLSTELLARWLNVLSVEPLDSAAVDDFPGRTVPAVPLDLLDTPSKGSNNLLSINGWHSKGEDLPALLTNSSDNLERIPGDAAPHSVVVHPNPTEFVAVAWNSPITGAIRVRAAITHAHPACGNGVAWWLEHRRGERAAMWAEGRLDLGQSASPPERAFNVLMGDTILLAVDAKDGDHSCDLTMIDLNISTDGGKTWNLARDVADTVLDGNPHADRIGNRSVWSFVKGPTRTVEQGGSTGIPPESILGRWRTAAADPRRKAEVIPLSSRAQTMLTLTRPGSNDIADQKAYDLLLSADGPLFKGLDLTPFAKPRGESFGVQKERFTDGCVAAAPDSVIEIRLPAALFAGREFVVDGRLKSASPDSAVLFQASAFPVAGPLRWDGKSGVVVSVEVYKRLLQGFDSFRTCFPLFLCYPNVIPTDEVVNLKMFHREDEPLRRLFLSDAQARQLDHLWDDHTFISRQPSAENRYLPLFIGFVTQDQPKAMVSFFEGQRSAFKKRSEEFDKVESAAIPLQLAALAEFSSRAFRRPLTPQEKAQQFAIYNSLREKSSSHEEAFRAVLARILISPAFLFRMELAPAGSKPGSIDDWELATRLSYFLWSSAPDDELRKLAAAGRLHVPDVLAAETRRMLKDGKVRSMAIEFGAQWLHVRGIDTQNDKDEKLFPSFNADLRKAIYEETILFFQDLFQQNRPAANLLAANYTYLDERLAKHYGIPGVNGPQWRRVDNVERYGRGGVLGLASVLSSESGASRTSPVLRGNWVSETLLGEKLPRPPPNVPKPPDSEGVHGLTMRQELEKHRQDPACAVCHERFDPYGFALEHYDPIGRYRQKDLGGVPVDDNAMLKDGKHFAGIEGLRSYLLSTRKSQFMHLFSRRLLGYALGRSVINSDMPLIDRIAVELENNRGIDEAVLRIVDSPQFRMRRP